ncbi:hypothetical protein PSP20601_00768 [Pandoraea sputorum]|uniref:Uncharacterized protein n=3 Tax=Pandoraea sputorum TaxID=93222 RepID=A0A239S6M7_9BURK|nr:Uncharacterised protein [Pandoraea sputorum]VVD74246.1 hypothetical protein PSP20601_00768 [Pandoraea sputorum]
MNTHGIGAGSSSMATPEVAAPTNKSPRANDMSFEAQLRGYIGSKYVVVVSGYDDVEYSDPSKACRAISMALNRVRSIHGNNVLFVSEGLRRGIGIAYEAAAKHSIPTLGIMEYGDKKFGRTMDCDHFLYVENSNTRSPRVPGSDERVWNLAIKIGRENRGGELLAIGDGVRPLSDALAAAEDGYKVTFFKGFDNTSGIVMGSLEEKLCRAREKNVRIVEHWDVANDLPSDDSCVLPDREDMGPGWEIP